MYDLLVTIILILGSGFFSGLTIALMSFEKEDLLVIKEIGGTGDSPYTYIDSIRAQKVLEIIKDKKLLVVTLLLGNTAVNATLSIFLTSMVGEGLQAGIASTFLILIFGEILPVIIITRYPLSVGAFVNIPVKILMFLFLPISYFIILGLNYLEKKLGDLPIVNLSRTEMIYNIKKLEEDETSDIDKLDSSLIEGALSLRGTKIKEIMTKRNNVFRLKKESVITKELLEKIIKSGYTRIPVFEDDEHEKFIGVFHVKKLIGESPLGKTVNHYIDRNRVVILDSEMYSDDAISKLLDGSNKKQHHLALVSNGDFWEGIVTLEDIVEEILKREIIDEFDKE